MRVSNLALTLVLAAFSLASPGPQASTAAVAPPLPSLKYLFTASATFGKFPKSAPIPSGVQLIELVTGGTIAGPALNGTIANGLVYPLAYQNVTLLFPQLLITGTTHDGKDFLVSGAGVGSNGLQWSRLDVTIGGKYAYLAKEFVLADLIADRAANTIKANAWCVGC